MNFKTHVAVVGVTTVAWTAAALYLSPVTLSASSILLTTGIAAVESSIAWGIFLGTKKLITAGFNRAAEKAATLDGSSLSTGATYAKDTLSNAYTSTSRFFGNMWNRQQQPTNSQPTAQASAQPTTQASTSPKAKKK